MLFGMFMLGVATATSARRIGAPGAWPLVGAALASGVLPTLAVIRLGSGALHRRVAGTGHRNHHRWGGDRQLLSGRRIFAALRDDHGSLEAGLSIGLPRPDAIDEVIGRHLPEALVPGLDQTRTVGLVTLPGAFVGVLLGGGTPIQAGAAQLLVLIGLL